MKKQSPGTAPRVVCKRLGTAEARTREIQARALFGQSEAEAEWESSESHCIHNCSSPEPKAKPWRLNVREGNVHQILVKLHQSLGGRKKACVLDESDHVSLVKFSLEACFSYFKALPRQAYVLAVLSNYNTTGMCCCLQMSEIFQKLEVWGTLLFPVT